MVSELPVTLFCAILVLVHVAEISANEDIYGHSVFPGRTRPPGLKWPKKCWWVKEITPDLFISGRLTHRQIQYAAECGFKTIISLYTYPASDKKFGYDQLPNTEEEREIVEETCGLKFVHILPPDAEWTDWSSGLTVKQLSEILPTVDKPILLHDNKGNEIPFAVLMFLANQTRQNPKFEPRITSDDFYNISAAMGLDFTDRMQMEVVSSMTGKTIPVKPPRPNTIPKRWEDFWMAHPVYKGWFTAGQITHSHIKALEKVGFRSVINLRSGRILDGKPNQEEVNLLNIMSDTGTYASDKKEPRQWKSRLEATKIDPDRPKRFVGPHSPVNYEMTNPEEFGDRVGYEEETERDAFKGSSIKYYHIPVDSKGPFRAFLDKQLPEIIKISEQGPVLVHCDDGKRSAYVAVLAAAVQYDKDLAWAIRRSRELGYEVFEGMVPELYHAYVYWLITKRTRDEL